MKVKNLHMRGLFLAVEIGAACACLSWAPPAVAGNCRDPWVTKAILQVTGHAPRGSYESDDCSIYLYGHGHWSSYPDLVNKVRAGYPTPTASLIRSGANPGLVGSNRPLINNNGRNGVGIIGQDGASLISQDGVGVVSHDGGTLVGGSGSGFRR